jgi:drug/metabolite transporter (DMT)-like permease
MVRRADDKEAAPLGMVLVCMIASVAWAIAVDRESALPPRALAWTVAAGLAEGGYVVSLGRALRDAPLGLAYATSRGGAMLLVWPISIAFLGERPTALALIGAATLCVGLVVANVPGKSELAKAKLGWSWITAAFIAAYHLAYGRALEEGIQAPSAVAISITIGVAVALVSQPRGRRLSSFRAISKQPVLIIASGLLAAASFLVFLEGLGRSGAGAALSLRNTSIAFTIVLSALMGERATPRQWIGTAIIAAGAVLVGH